MIKTVKTINLKIANFPIKLVFHPTDWPANRDHLIQEVLFMLSGFVVKISPEKTQKPPPAPVKQNYIQLF